MNPGVSFAITGVFFQSFNIVITFSNTVSSVCKAGMTSTKGISGAGLKKWTPRKRIGLMADDARLVMDKEEVLVAKIQSSIIT